MTFVTTSVILYIKNKKFQDLLVKLAVEKTVIGKKLESAIAENESSKLEKDDGFIKFLSISRESAFTYIEEVQEAISKYASDRTEDNYKKLISFLPKEDEKR